MAFFLAVGVGLVAWPLVSHQFSQLPFGGLTNNGGVITPQLSTFIERTRALENITGLSAAVVSTHDTPAAFHAWGHRTEDGDTVTSDTLFYMASVSKAFCATALGLLIDDFARGVNATALPPGVHALTWHTRLAEVVPGWGLVDAWAAERATLRDVLAHVSGVPRHDAAYGPADTPEGIVARLKYLRPAFEFREQWSYNNIMYVVAAHVIATYAGQSYTSFVEQRLFAPLGMNATTFSPGKAAASGTLSQGWTREGRRVPVWFMEETACAMAGPGGIISNAVDMAKWISTWMNEGVYDNRTIIPLSVYQNVLYAVAVATGHPPDPQHAIVGYGMGWFRSSYRGHDVLYHSGALPGFSSLVSFLPSDGIGVALFANGESKVETLTMISNRILDSALHLPSPPTRATPRTPFRHVTTTPDTRNITSSLDAFAGTYTNPGYGSFTLCSPSGLSAYCAQVQSDFATVDRVQGNSPHPGRDLLAAWPRVWSSHVRMRHQEGVVFDMYFTSLYPRGYGKDVTPFETRAAVGTTGGEGVAEFVVEDGAVVGFGLSGVAGRVTGRARAYDRVQDRAEVWFDKVSQGDIVGWEMNGRNMVYVADGEVHM